MTPKLLLPHRYKRIGWIIAIPSFILMLAVLHADFQFEFLTYTQASNPLLLDNGFLFNIQSNNFTDELGGILLITGLLLIAFSKEKDEDERIAAIRLESLLWAVLINSILLMLAIILLYNALFLQAMAHNICTTLILFIARFNLKLYFDRKTLKSNTL